MRVTTTPFPIDGRRALRWLALAGIVAAVAIGGCAELAHKERELVFRVVPGDASWYAGLPDGVREIDIPVVEGQHIHARRVHGTRRRVRVQDLTFRR